MRLLRTRLANCVTSLALVLSACSALGEPVSLSVPTSPPAPRGQACPAALLQGALVADERWGVALATESGSQPVRWPHGFYARQSGVLTLHQASGRVVASQAQTLYVGGGMDPANELFVACGYVSRDPP